MHGKIEMVPKRPVDTREPITVWQLLIWAYRRQMVHYEADGPDGPQMCFQASALASLAKLGWFDCSTNADSWSINAASTTAHPDAHCIHERVCCLSPAERDLIISSAIQGQVPEWNPDIHPFRVVPVRKGGSGAPRMIYGKSHRPIACMIDYEGVPQEEAEAITRQARETYSHWWKLLRRLRLSVQVSGHRLTRWKIAEIGVPRVPWNCDVG